MSIGWVPIDVETTPTGFWLRVRDEDGTEYEAHCTIVGLERDERLLAWRDRDGLLADPTHWFECSW
jgi:hypothetical protein